MPEPVQTKRCPTCKINKPIEQFNRNAHMPDGLAGQCRACRAAHRSTPEYKAKAAAYLRRWNAAHPGSRHRNYRDPDHSRDLARFNLRNWVRRGKIQKPDRCESCGAKSPRLHGHHSDYSKPAEVKWLCPLCHAREHTALREKAKATRQA